jgi:hypothetical protein
MRSTKLLLAGVSIILAACAAQPSAPAVDMSAPLTVVSDTMAAGFGWPESVGCDSGHNVLYVSQFGGEKPNPPAKDGKGYISKVSPDGTILEQHAFNVQMNKPKGIWIEGTRLWVTDIDSIWIFDTVSKQYKHLMIPGITFANDVAIWNGGAYVSDNRADELYRIEPADFLRGAAPRITKVWEKTGIFPNGLWPGKDGRLIMVGMESPEKPKGIWAMDRDGKLEALSRPIGRLDGLYERADGTLLATDWDSGSVFRYGPNGHVQVLGKDFKGPADLCVMGDTVYVPDLVKGEVRLIKLDR